MELLGKQVDTLIVENAGKEDTEVVMQLRNVSKGLAELVQKSNDAKFGDSACGTGKIYPPLPPLVGPVYTYIYYYDLLIIGISQRHKGTFYFHFLQGWMVCLICFFYVI